MNSAKTQMLPVRGRKCAAKDWTLASMGGGAATMGALVQKMPMPPGLGGV
jgi:hypothetical protein